jgi:hypothetical protein
MQVVDTSEDRALSHYPNTSTRRELCVRAIIYKPRNSFEVIGVRRPMARMVPLREEGHCCHLQERAGVMRYKVQCAL